MKKKQTRLTSADLGLKYDPAQVSPPVRGPQTGMSQLPDCDFIAAFATPAELARWREEIEQRRAQPQPQAFFRCTNPSCKTVLRDRSDAPTGDPCPRCNLLRRVDGGHLRRMTDTEANDYILKQAQRDKAEDARRARARFNATNLDRAKHGLPAMTFSEFTASERREFEEMKAQGRALGEMASLCRPRAR